MTIKNPSISTPWTKCSKRNRLRRNDEHSPSSPFPGLDENVQRENIGSQVDLYPTILNLPGWDRSNLPHYGDRPLKRRQGETENNVVFPQTHMLKGSYITKDRLFEVSRDTYFRTFATGGSQITEGAPVKEAAPLYQRATLTLDYAYRLLRDNRLMDLDRNEE